ncbi:MAG: hypothetical protein DRP42_06340 [Tenericutes bacterium]|nr:MAG: hypothetical protein DRP42_06340 [Mycoplasmatota bacterium]
MAEIEAMLEGVGFSRTMSVRDGTERRVYAAHKGAELEFGIDVERVVKAMIDDASRNKQQHIRKGTTQGKGWLEDIREQAERVGWRLLREHVKAQCDSVKLGVVTIAEAFAGQLLLKGPRGPVRLASVVTMAIEEGTFNSPRLMNQLMITGPK